MSRLNRANFLFLNGDNQLQTSLKFTHINNIDIPLIYAKKKTRAPKDFSLTFPINKHIKHVNHQNTSALDKLTFLLISSVSNQKHFHLKLVSSFCYKLMD